MTDQKPSERDPLDAALAALVPARPDPELAGRILVHAPYPAPTWWALARPSIATPMCTVALILGLTLGYVTVPAPSAEETLDIALRLAFDPSVDRDFAFGGNRDEPAPCAILDRTFVDLNGH